MFFKHNLIRLLYSLNITSTSISTFTYINYWLLHVILFGLFGLLWDVHLRKY